MNCPHCAVTVHMNWIRGTIRPDRDGFDWGWEFAYCPSCTKAVIYISKASTGARPAATENSNRSFETRRMVEPRYAFRTPLGEGVPDNLKDDYLEACAVLDVSPKASAALSRRVLQAILREQGYHGRDLSKQIDRVLEETKSDKALPPSIKKTVDAIRNFGNFSAHPITDETSLQIIDVEPEEADWCLQIVERLFDHYYVRPVEDQKMLDDLNEKLNLAGKPPAKP